MEGNPLRDPLDFRITGTECPPPARDGDRKLTYGRGFTAADKAILLQVLENSPERNDLEEIHNKRQHFYRWMREKGRLTDY